ncbi:Xaa-Pro aminopeptidase [Breznakia sp. PF5-3]|uniref:M24 family metallopeptidase n=1 Tax=unclassified Breznakia TaxID=2623764 RepID=UPI002406B571|nr:MULTISPECIES: M24 family metallopeptidase [unclassified Breznakia]MDF9824209.1 Xaa-Pro aminopeptidase [Breznakia sp. PM6-1]MDF9835007.1 Xaa-Pro aminopeptidase [Breznakia sp. PF5-3]MDF9837252.1 Xaa-Pro aminopeptidase [Breznakia sp. PFB2-8]MDF9859242.1 Xaa-Pro aminopeptidase [Breznakia sp. PH5-24]
MIELKRVKRPEVEYNIQPVELSDDTIKERKNKILKGMKCDDIDVIIIYADLEHGSNFEYLCGFLPRFEEALLVLHSNGEAYMVLGNENLNKASKARIKVNAIHMPHFSLPNQPMDNTRKVSQILAECKINQAKKIGIVGWKNFTNTIEDYSQLFDIPYFVMDGLKEVCPNAKFVNGTYLFIGEEGARNTNNANEIAHYEFGATLAGNCMLEALAEFEIGKSEMEIASRLSSYGQRHSVVTIMAAGERFINANMYPSSNEVKLGDKISITTGYKGGLQSRGGYAVSDEEQLPINERDYVNRVAKPYFKAVVTWLEMIKIGIDGTTLYSAINTVLPKDQYGWSLNPGHLCADEEWLSSPVYPNSKEEIKSGMLFQIDIIPSIKGYGGASCESGVVLADANLRAEIKSKYPQMWQRFVNRRKFIMEELGIELNEEVLPTSIATAYFTPYLLNKDKVLAVIK